MASTWGVPRHLNPLGGLRAFAGGITFIVGTPSVWPYAAVPAVLLLVLMCGLTVGGYYGGTGYAREWVAGHGVAADWAVKVLVAVLAFVAGLFAALVLAQPLSGFALEKIAHAQERALTGETGHRPTPSGAFLRGIWVALVTVAVGGVVFTTLFAVGLIFPPALVVTVPLKFVFAAWLLAWDFLDYPLGLRGLGLFARLRWAGRNFGAFTVFGVAWVLLVIVPGIILLLLPMGVAGATRLVVEDERRG